MRSTDINRVIRTYNNSKSVQGRKNHDDILWRSTLRLSVAVNYPNEIVLLSCCLFMGIYFAVHRRVSLQTKSKDHFWGYKNTIEDRVNAHKRDCYGS